MIGVQRHGIKTLGCALVYVGTKLLAHGVRDANDVVSMSDHLIEMVTEALTQAFGK